MRNISSIATLKALVQFSRRNLLSFLLAVLSWSICTVQAFGAGGDPMWQTVDSLPGKQQATSSVVDSQGNFILAGFQNLTGGTNDDYYTVKYDSNGGVLWRATYHQPGGSNRINDVTVDFNDDVIVTGFVWNGVNTDIYTIKYCGATGSSSCGGKAGGEIIWQQVYNGAANGNDTGVVVSVEPGSNDVYVGGYSQNLAGKEDYLLIKYAAPDGALRWQPVRYSGPPGSPGINKISSISAGASGVAVTGQSWNGSVFECATIKYAPDGTQLWPQVKRYTDGPYTCSGKIVKMDSAGDVVMAASASNGLDLDIYVAKYCGATGSPSCGGKIGGEILWERNFDGRDSDEPRSMTIDSDDNVFVTGYSFTLTGHNDFYTAKHDAATGAIIWYDIHDSGMGNSDITAESESIVVDSLGESAFVTGYTISGGVSSIETIKYNVSNGKVVWQQLFNGTAGKNSRSVGLGLDLNDNIMIAGWADSANNDLDYVSLKYDRGVLNPPTDLNAQAHPGPSVSLTWISNSTQEDGFKIERCANYGCSDFAQIGTAGKGITTYTDSAGLDKDKYYSYRVRAYNAANGNTLYSNVAQVLTTSVPVNAPNSTYTYNSTADSDDSANAIAVGPDGNPVITGFTHDYYIGYSSGNVTYDYLTIKLNRSTMSPIWSARYDDPNSQSDIATCVAVDNNNISTVSGFATLDVGNADVNSLYTLRYKAAAAAPQTLSADQYNGSGATDDRAVAIATAVDASNNVAVVGYGKNPAGNDDIYLLKYLANGTRQWDRTFDGGKDDIPSAVAFAPDGSIYVTGRSEKSTSVPASQTFNFYTARYDASGNLIWQDVYNVAPANGDNAANGLAVDANGDLYVTGYATNVSGNADFYTIKYKGGNSTAQRLWEQAADGLGHGDDKAIGIGVDPIDGNIIVAGTSVGQAGDADYRVIRYAPDGTVVWDKTYQKPGTAEQANAMAIDSNGAIYVTGNTFNGTTRGSLTVKFNPLQGDVVSTTLYNGAANKSDDTGSITINQFDEVFAAGYSTKSDATTDLLVYKVVPNLPTAPIPLTATTPTLTTAMFSWPTRSSDKDGYYLQRQDSACADANPNPWSASVLLSAAANSYNDINLIPGATYCYRIQSYRNSDSTVSRWKQVTVTLPASSAPTGMTGSVVNTTQINLNWNDTTNGETGFRVERCAGASCSDSDFAQIGTIRPANTTSYNDVDAAYGTVYKYRVIAVGTGWESAQSNIFTASVTPTPTTPVLAAPSRISEVQINLSWTDASNTDETGYKIYRCSGSGCTPTVQLGNNLAADTFSYSDTSVVPGTTYVYAVSAFKTATSVWEKVSSASGDVTATIMAPSGVTATANNTTQITVGWTKNTTSQTGFKILRCEGSGCTPDPAAPIHTALPTATSYADGTVKENTTYNYQVVATNNVVPWDSPVSAKVERSTPAAATPSAPTVSWVSEAKLHLVWSDAANSDESGYKVYRCAGSGCTPTVQIGLNLNPNTFSYDDGTVTPGTTYVYRVSAFKTATNSWEKVSASSSDSQATILEPNNITATANSTTQITVGWSNRTSTQTGFKILRCEGSGCTPDPAAPIYTALPTATSYADGIVKENTTYNYQVVATNNVVPWDSPVSAKVERSTPAAATPSAPTVSWVSEAKIHLAWSDAANSDESGYKIYRCAGSGCMPTVQIGLNQNQNTFSYDDSTVNPGDTYVYRVSAFKTTTNGWEKVSASSADIQATILEPNNFTATANNTTQITLGWSDRTATETGFEVWRCANPPCAYAYLATAGQNAISYSDNTASYGTTYSYQVRAVNTTVPWQSQFTTLAAPISTPSPVAPVLASPAATEQSVSLSWNDPNNDESFVDVLRCTGDTSVCTTIDKFATVKNGLAANSISYTDSSSIIANTTYTYQVKVYKSGSWSVFSNKVVATTTVQPPSNLQAATAGTTRINLNWTNNTTSENGFTVERCSGTGCSDFSVVSSTVTAHSTTFSDLSVCSGISYTYRIKAKNTALGWESGYSGTAGISTPQPATSYPNLLIDPNFEEAASGWTAAPNIGGTPGATTGTSIDTGTYYNGAKSLKVVGDASSAMGASQTVTVVAGQTYFLAGYVNSTLTAGSAVCNVYGTGITSDPGFSIVANDPRNNTWVNLNEVVTIPGGTTSVQVQCYSTAGSTGTVNFDSLSFNKVFAVTATAANESKINLSWSDVASDDTGYNILRCAGSGCTNFTKIGAAGANATSYADTGLTPLATYNYLVQAYKTGVTCGWANPGSAAAAAATLTPAAPTALTATKNNTTQITLGWTNNTLSETGYEIQRCTSSDCSAVDATITVTGTGKIQQSDTGVANGTQYWYRIRSTNGIVAGWPTAWSSTPYPTATTDAAIKPVLTVTPYSDTQINLSWTASNPDVTSYTVQRCTVITSGCNDVPIKTGLTVLTYSDTSVVMGEKYRYTIQAIKVAAQGWTKNSDQSADALPIAAAPTGLNVRTDPADPNNTTKLIMNWTNVTTSHNGVIVERCTGNNCNSGWSTVATVSTAPMNSYTDTSVCSNTWYTYRVSATNSAASTPWTSNPGTSSTATTKTPVAPTALSLTANNEGQITLNSWSLGATSDADGFKIYRCAGSSCTPSALLNTLTGIATRTYTDNSGVLANTPYTYKVTATKSSSCAAESAGATASATTVNPPLPTVLTASPASSTSVNLAWNDNTIWETKFSIERRCTATGSGATCVGTFAEIGTIDSPAAPNSKSPPQATYSDGTVARLTTYEYRVRAKNTAWTASTPYAGYSDYSNTYSVTTPDSGPPAPVTETHKTNSVTLTWGDNCSGATQETGFDVLRCTNSGCTPVTIIASPGANSTSSATYVDTTVCSGTLYRYQINSKGASCTYSSAPLLDVTTATQVDPVLTAVTRSSESKLSLAWTDATPDTNTYTIERCIGNLAACALDANFSAVATGVVGTSRSYDDSYQMLPGTTYTYRVKGIGSGASCTAWQTKSNSVSQVANVSDPVLTASVSNLSQINLTWTDPDTTITGWKIERCIGAGCTDFAEITPAPALTGASRSYSDTSVTAGTTYQYRIRAVGNSQIYTNYIWVSNYSAVASATPILPVAPASFTATSASTSQINLAWAALGQSDLDGYAIERCKGTGCLDFTELARVTPYTAATRADTGLDASTTYRYRVRGYKNTGGIYTAYSQIAEAMTLMNAPGSLSASLVASSAVKLAWDEIFAGQDSIAVEVQILSGDWVQLATLDGLASEYIDASGVNPLTTYTYRVRAFRGAVSATSNLATVTIPGYTQGSTAVCPPGQSPNQPLITSVPATAATEKVLYSYHVTAIPQGTAGSITAYQLSLKPNGMAIDGSGTITWTPDYTESGNVNVTVRVTDNLGASTSQSFVIAVANDPQTPRINSAAVTKCSGIDCTEGHAYTYQVAAYDPENKPLTYDLTTAPAMMTISSAGLITWTAQAGANNVTVSVSNGSKAVTQSFTVPVGTYHAPSITSTAPTSAVNGATYSYQVTMNNPDGYPLSYSLINTGGTPPPAGMSVTAAGLVTWVPSSTQSINNPITIQVTDGVTTLTQAFTITIDQFNAPTITSSPGATPQAQEGTQYVYQVTASAPLSGACTNTTCTYSLTTAPAGMGIDANGRITWTPGTAQGGAAVPVTVRVQAGPVSANNTLQSFTIAVPYISSTPGTPPRGGVGAAYSYTAAVNKLWAAGSPVYSLDTKPAWMSVNSSTGAITGTPTAGGTFPVTVRATIGAVYATQSYNLAVLSFSAMPGTTAAVGSAYNSSATAVDPAGGSITYALAAKPAGMTIDPATGAINWPAPTAGVSQAITVTATVGGVTISAAPFTINSLSVTSTAVTAATVNSAYSYQVTTTGAPSGYSLDVKPAWMSINGTGLLSGTPDATGSIPVTVRVTTAGGYYATQSFNIASAPYINTPAAVTAAVSQAFSTTITAGPVGDTFTFGLTSPPAGMTIVPSTGVINWTPAANQTGMVPVTVTATANGVTGSKTINLSVLSITDSTTMTAATVGAVYSYQVHTTGTPTGYSFTSSVPAGMTISAGGLISWPVPVLGSYSPITVMATTSGGYSVTQSYSLTVMPQAPAVPAPNPVTVWIDTGDCANPRIDSAVVNWTAVAAPSGGSVKYSVLLDGVTQTAWQSLTSYTVTGAHSWQVKARDENTLSESAWSSLGYVNDTGTGCSSSSCPLVYAWDGAGFSYESDLQGPAISQIKKGARNVTLYQPSYIVLENLVPDANNQYRVMIWESLNEATLLDEAKLLAVDYPDGYQIVSSGAENTYYYGYADPFRIYTVKDPILPITATEKHGYDVLASVLDVDDNPAPMVPSDTDNYYTFDFGTIQHPEYAKLVIDAWQIINSKIFTSTVTIQPYVEVVDGNGAWVKVKSFGMPMGDLKTMVVDLSGKFLSSDHRIRVHLGIKKAQVWVIDRIRLDDSAPVAVTVQELQATAANLQLGGEVIQEMNTLQHRILVSDDILPVKTDFFGFGNFTRYGDVGELLTQRDDKYVIMNYADKVDLTFPALPAPQVGKSRGFILKADNYYKEFKEYKYLDPLPFHGMSDYPPPAPEAYPTDDDHNLYRSLYNTRVVAP